MGILGEMRQGRPGGDPARIERKAEDALERIQELETRLERLTQVNQAMWSLLKEVTGLTEEALVERTKALEAAARPAEPDVPVQGALCPQCGRSVSLRHNRCLFCDFELQETNAFRAVAR